MENKEADEQPSKICISLFGMGDDDPPKSDSYSFLPEEGEDELSENNHEGRQEEKGDELMAEDDFVEPEVAKHDVVIVEPMEENERSLLDNTLDNECVEIRSQDGVISISQPVTIQVSEEPLEVLQQPSPTKMELPSIAEEPPVQNEAVVAQEASQPNLFTISLNMAESEQPVNPPDQKVVLPAETTIPEPTGIMSPVKLTFNMMSETPNNEEELPVITDAPEGNLPKQEDAFKISLEQPIAQTSPEPAAEFKISLPQMMAQEPTPAEVSDHPVPLADEPQFHDQPMLDKQLSAIKIPMGTTEMEVDYQAAPIELAAEPVAIQAPRQRKQKIQLQLLDLYSVKHRSVAIKLDPEAKCFKGQITFELSLNTDQAQKYLDFYKTQNVSKIAVGTSILAKQVQVIDFFHVSRSEGAVQKDKQIQLQGGESLANPNVQARVPLESYGHLSRNLFQFEHIQRGQYINQLQQGHIQLRKQLFKLRPRKDDISTIKPTITLMISFFCEQITDIGGIRSITYLRDREDTLNDKDATSRKAMYFHTSDFVDQSLCWMPALQGTQRQASTWSLKFSVPKNYMVVASGSQTGRVFTPDHQAIHEYKLGEDEQTWPDKIGFLCCLVPHIQALNDQQSQFACFVSRQKQGSLNPKLVGEVIDYISNLLAQKDYPVKQMQMVFLPNLFPAKHHQQSINFAGGLHLLDQDNILFKPSQIDKRHHTYKHLATALAYDFFGNRVSELVPSDNWLLVAIRERIGDRFKKKRCGTLLYRYQVMKSIEKLYKQMKHGVETTPLQKQYHKNEHDMPEPPELQGFSCPHPSEQEFNDIFYRKCGLIMHMIESSIDESNLDKILRALYQDATTATESEDLTSLVVIFRKRFRRICGMQPLNYYKNWIWATNCPKLELTYTVHKKNSTLEVHLKQTPAAQSHFKLKKTIDQKLNKIFGMKGSQLKSELLKDETPAGMETFYVDMKQACRRWFVGDINLVIYQVEGSGGDILPQQHKMSLKDFKSEVVAHIPLQGKVKRAMQNKKKEFDQFVSYAGTTSQDQRTATIERKTHHASQAQLHVHSEKRKFEMNEFELEDFPQETKNIFSARDLDSNPILWIRVDPDMEFIRKVKITHPKRNNWLFQLLREQDIIGQIEAVKQLPKYNQDLVYEILKTVSRNANYFYKVRKCVLKALQKMEISAFNKYISHEMFLLRFFNNRNYDENIGFYKANHFANLLDYNLDRCLIKAISMCKEEKLPLKADKQKELDDFKQQRDERGKKNGGEDKPTSRGSSPSKSMIQLSLVDNTLVGATKPEDTYSPSQTFDESQFKITTDTVASMLFKVLEQNDNSENPFDDSFYIKEILTALGRLDNMSEMPKIASEIYRQFRLDQISNTSPQFSITLGAIKAHYNMRKQIFNFVNSKSHHIDESSENKVVKNFKQQIEKSEESLNLMKKEIDRILLDESQPLSIRTFIFVQEVKSIFLYRNIPFIKALQSVLNACNTLQARMQIRFAIFCIKELALFLESEKFLFRLNFTELYLPHEMAQGIIRTLWSFISMPHTYLSNEFSYWVKRIMNRLYGSKLPEHLQQMDKSLDPCIQKWDDNWKNTEQKLASDDLIKTTQEEQAQQIAQQHQSTQQQKHPTFGIKIDTSAPVDEGKIVLKGLLPDNRVQNVLNLSSGDAGLGSHQNIQIGGHPMLLHQRQSLQIDEEEEMALDQVQEEVIPDTQAPKGNKIVLNIFDGVAQSQETTPMQEDNPYQQAPQDPSESEIDPFAETSFQDPTMQKCWEILGHMYYHFEATDFLEPVTEELFGTELFEDYCEVIKTPMDLTTIMNKCKEFAYPSKEAFFSDVMLVFENCKKFNEPHTEIYSSATKLVNYFRTQWRRNFT